MLSAREIKAFEKVAAVDGKGGIEGKDRGEK